MKKSYIELNKTSRTNNLPDADFFNLIFMKKFQMHTSYITFMAALLVLLFAGMSVFFLQNQLVRKKSINLLYLLTAGLAVYCIESTSYGQPLTHTILLVMILCLVPIGIDNILDRNHKSKH